MIRTALACIFVLTAPATPARAELPAYILDKDYQNCVGDDPNDRDRAAYCACIRDNMRNWDIDTYMGAATQAAANAVTGNGKTPGKIEDIAKQCIAQVMH